MTPASPPISSTSGTVPDPGDKTGKRAEARQQDLVLDEPRRGEVDENGGALHCDPGSVVEPAHGPPVGDPLAEGRVAVAAADLYHMSEAGSRLGISGERRRLHAGDGGDAGDAGDDGGRGRDRNKPWEGEQDGGCREDAA